MPAPWPLMRWISASPKPLGAIASRTPFSLVDWLSLVFMREPDSKSMPKFRPMPAMASAPTRRMTPDIEKNHFEAPMKSKCRRRRRLPTPSGPSCG